MNRLEELRKEKGMSMRQAAAQMGMKYTTYRSYERIAWLTWWLT